MSIGKVLSGDEGLDALVQPALVTRRLVLVDDTLVYHAVDDRYGVFVCCHGGILVARITGLDDSFDLGTHQRAQAHILLAGLFRLAGALPG